MCRASLVASASCNFFKSILSFGHRSLRQLGRWCASRDQDRLAGESPGSQACLMPLACPDILVTCYRFLRRVWACAIERLDWCQTYKFSTLLMFVFPGSDDGSPGLPAGPRVAARFHGCQNSQCYAWHVCNINDFDSLPGCILCRHAFGQWGSWLKLWTVPSPESKCRTRLCRCSLGSLWALLPGLMLSSKKGRPRLALMSSTTLACGLSMNLRCRQLLVARRLLCACWGAHCPWMALAPRNSSSIQGIKPWSMLCWTPTMSSSSSRPVTTSQRHCRRASWGLIHVRRYTISNSTFARLLQRLALAGEFRWGCLELFFVFSCTN